MKIFFFRDPPSNLVAFDKLSVGSSRTSTDRENRCVIGYRVTLRSGRNRGRWREGLGVHVQSRFSVIGYPSKKGRQRSTSCSDDCRFPPNSEKVSVWSSSIPVSVAKLDLDSIPFLQTTYDPSGLVNVSNQ